MSVDRYITILETSLEIQQKKLELEKLYNKLYENTTVSESMRSEWKCEESAKALKVIDGLSIEKNVHVKCQAKYKDVSISLHCAPSATHMVMSKIFNATPKQ